MIEAGDVGRASHANNTDAAIGTVESGGDAFLALVRWTEDHRGWESNAVIVTADHGHMFVLDAPERFADRSRGKEPAASSQ